MEKDFAREKVAMSDAIGEGAVQRVGEGNCPGKGAGEGEEGGKKEGENPRLKSMLVVKGEGRVRRRSTVSVRLRLHPYRPHCIAIF